MQNIMEQYNTRQINIRVSQELYNALRTKANRNSISYSGYIKNLILKDLKDAKEQKKWLKLVEK